MSNSGSFYAVITAALFATLGIFTKYIYNYHLSSEMVFLSSSIISTIVTFFILLIKEKNPNSLKIRKVDFIISFIVAGFLALFCCNISVLKSLNYIDAGVQKVIAYSSPIFTTFIYVTFFRRKITKLEFASLSVMLVGLILIIGNMNFTDSSIFKGILFSLMAAIFSSLYSIITEEFKTEINFIVYWFYAFLGASVSVLIYMIFNSIPINFAIITSNFELTLLLLASAILNFVIPYITQFLAIGSIGAIKTGVILTLSPVLCVLLGVFLLGEGITFLQIVGMVLVVIASLVISKK